VRFEPSGRSVSVAAGSSLLEAARGAGLPIASACGGDSLCGRCGVSILAGEVTPEDAGEAQAKQRNRVPAGERLACRALVSSDLAVTASYW